SIERQQVSSDHYPAFSSFRFLFFFHDPATTSTSTLSLHDALPIFVFTANAAGDAAAADLERVGVEVARVVDARRGEDVHRARGRSEEHTSELQSPYDLVCRLLLEKKNDRRD